MYEYIYVYIYIYTYTHTYDLLPVPNSVADNVNRQHGVGILQEGKGIFLLQKAAHRAQLGAH
jgi:hypothetical protein